MKVKQSTLDTWHYRMLHCAHGLYYRNCTLIGVISTDNAMLRPEGDFGRGICDALSNAKRSFHLITTEIPELSQLNIDFRTAIRNATLLQDSIPGGSPGLVSTLDEKGKSSDPCFNFCMPIFDKKVIFMIINCHGS